MPGAKPKGLAPLVVGSPILLHIWLVLHQQVLGLNLAVLGKLAYANKFTRDAIYKCGEISFGLPHRVFA